MTTSDHVADVLVPLLFGLVLGLVSGWKVLRRMHV